MIKTKEQIEEEKRRKNLERIQKLREEGKVTPAKTGEEKKKAMEEGTKALGDIEKAKSKGEQYVPQEEQPQIKVADVQEKKEAITIAAEEAGAYRELPEAPIETIPGESERGTFEKFKEGIKNSGFMKAYNYIDTLGGIGDFNPQTQQEIVISAQKDEIREDLEEQIDATSKELDNQVKQMGIGAGVAGGVVVAGVAELGIAETFFASEDKVNNLKSSIEALNQLSTTISGAVRENSLSGQDGLKMEANIRKLLDLRRQQIKEIAIGSSAVRVKDELIDVDTDLYEAQIENTLETNVITEVLYSGEAQLEPSQAQLLITKRRIENAKKD